MSVDGGLLRLRTSGHTDVVDVTGGVASVVRRSGVQTGVAVVWVTGSTAAITTMEHEPGGVADLQGLLDRLIPADEPWEHNVRNHDSNAHAHLRAAIVGPSESIPVVGGELALGTWQQVVLVDFDDRARERLVTVQVLS